MARSLRLSIIALIAAFGTLASSMGTPSPSTANPLGTVRLEAAGSKVTSEGASVTTHEWAYDVTWTATGSGSPFLTGETPAVAAGSLSYQAHTVRDFEWLYGHGTCHWLDTWEWTGEVHPADAGAFDPNISLTGPSASGDYYVGARLWIEGAVGREMREWWEGIGDPPPGNGCVDTPSLLSYENWSMLGSALVSATLDPRWPDGLAGSTQIYSPDWSASVFPGGPATMSYDLSRHEDSNPVVTPTATNTATSTATATNTATSTATITATPTSTATATHTNTPTASSTNTPAATATSTPPPPDVPCADFNGSGNVTVRDLVALVRHLAPSRYDLLYDLNHDGRITVTDLFITVAQLGTSCS